MQESFSCTVQERLAQFFRSTDDTQEVPFNQLSEQFSATDSPNRFDFGPEHWLAISHHREGIEGRRRELELRGPQAREVAQFANPRGKLWLGEQSIPPGDVFDLESPPPSLVHPLKLREQRAGFSSIFEPRQLGNPPQAEGVARQKKHCLDPG